MDIKQQNIFKGPYHWQMHYLKQNVHHSRCSMIFDYEHVVTDKKLTSIESVRNKSQRPGLES
jgi:hypothetical protein